MIGESCPGLSPQFFQFDQRMLSSAPGFLRVCLCSDTLRWVSGRTFRSALRIALALLFVGPAANASPSREEAYRQGKAYFRVGAYQEAISEFKRSLKLGIKKTGVYFNIGRSYEELGDRNNAVDWYQRYIDVNAKGSAVAEAKARILKLEREIREQKVRRRAVKLENWIKQTQNSTSAVGLGAGVSADPPLFPGQAQAVQSKGQQPKLLGWVSVGAGILATVVAVVSFKNMADANSRRPDPALVAVDPALNAVDRQLVSDATGHRTVGFLSTGLALVGYGVGSYFFLAE